MALKRLYIATARSSAGAGSELAGDLVALGYAVSFDNELPDGERWWTRTLDAVEAADGFLYALTRASVDSPACQEQMEYAFALGKPVLPVLLDDDLSDVDLPTNLGAIQHVDYRARSSSAMADLFSALRGLNATADTVTATGTGHASTAAGRPECPPDFRLDIAERLSSPVHLTRGEQDTILERLDRYVESGFVQGELEPLVRGMRDRRLDLAAASSAHLDTLEQRIAASTATPITVAGMPAHTTFGVPDGDPPVRSLFMSYSRADRAMVDQLVADASRLGFKVWIDQNLPGGKRWWDQVLLNIREMDVFAFAISPHSLASRACLAELGYARGLGKPIAGIEIVSDLTGSDTKPVESIKTVPYASGDKPALAGVARLLTALARTDLPAQFPEPPEVPATYTFDVQNQLRSTNELDPEEQATLVSQIERYSAEGVPDGDVHRLVTFFRARPDVTMRTLGELDELERRLQPSTGVQHDVHEDESRDTSTGTVETFVAPETGNGTLESETGDAAPPPPPPPPPPPAPRHHRGRRVLIAVGAFVLVGIGAAVAIALTNSGDGGGGADPTNPPQPAIPSVETVETFAPLPDPTFAPTADPSFTGVFGDAEVDWAVNGIAHAAIIHTDGGTGTATVTNTVGTSVTETLTLLFDALGTPYYVGSNPIDNTTGAVATDYAVDAFQLQQQADGTFVFVAVCDEVNGCQPAATFGL